MADRAPGSPAVSGGPSPAIDAAAIEVVHAGAARPALVLDRLVIDQGERVALLGPSGGGKTTLLRLIAGLIEPARGRLTLGGWAPRAGRRRPTGMIFQDFALVERASVLENVLYGRLGAVPVLASLLGRFPADDQAVAWATVLEVGLGELVHQRVDRLSGGQRQRVAIARALAQQPAILLADEPVSNLDPSLTDGILDLLNAAHVRHGVTLVTSLHQPRLAGRAAERVLGIRDGRVAFDGPPSELSLEVLEEVYGRAFAARIDDDRDTPS